MYGVPRNSVLGPHLLARFKSPVAKVMNPDVSNISNIVSFHQYADDTQLYIGAYLFTLENQVTWAVKSYNLHIWDTSTLDMIYTFQLIALIARGVWTWVDACTHPPTPPRRRHCLTEFDYIFE